MMDLPAVEWFGLIAVTLMMGSYALEQRHPNFVLLFSGACLMAAGYAFVIGSYPFLIVEAIWSLVALRRWWRLVK